MPHRSSLVSRPPVAGVMPRREEPAGPPVPETPGPWERTPKGHDRELSLLVRGLYEKRAEILAHHPRVRLPTADPKISTPVAALIVAWERWGYMHGKCPECGALALGISFGGMLSRGSVGGVCTQCALVVSRPIAGMSIVAAGARESLKGTPYKFAYLNWRWGFRGTPRALVMVLRQLGVKELPKPSSGADEEWGGAYFEIQ